MIDLNNVIGFEWDKWNIDKSYKKHGISQNQTEEVFLDVPYQTLIKQLIFNGVVKRG